MLGFSVNAQSVFDRAAQDAANIICDCVNKTYKDIDELMADETGEKGKQFEACMESNNKMMEKKYSNLESEPGFSDEMMFDLMLEKLATKEKCALASMLMEMGRQAVGGEEVEEDDSDDE